MNKLIVAFLFVIAYFVIPSIFFFLLNQAKQEMSKKRKVKIEKSSNPLDDLTYLQKTKRIKNFALKEYSKKTILIAIFIATILFAPLVSFVNIMTATIAVIIMPFVFNSIASKITSKELNDKDNLIIRMLEFKKKKMGLIDSKSSILDYDKEFSILEYDETDKKPSKIRISLPVNFDPINSTQFINAFSIQFGRKRPFELDLEDKDYPGWDIDNGYATIKLQAPLPTKAIWEEWYITHPDIQWSFIPLGLGSKGGVPLEDPNTGETIHLIGYDCDGTQGDYMKSKGIPCGPDLTASPHSLGAGVTGGGKSVSQNNIINSCLMRPNDWTLFGIDMKKVELGKLRQYGVPVATTYKDACDIATFVQKLMLDRFEEMERRNINNWSKMPEEERGTAIMLMVDEVSELLAPVSGKSDEAKEIGEQQDIIRSALESIARLGRASFVFLTVWGQRPDSTVVSMQIRQNCPTRLAAGNLPGTISQMVFESAEGNRVPGNPKGRMLIKTHSIEPIHFQGFFADSEWIKNWLISNNKPINVYENNSITGIYEENKEIVENEDFMTSSDFDLIENSY